MLRVNENRAVEVAFEEPTLTDPTSSSEPLLEPLDVMTEVTEVTEKETEEAPLETEESLNDGQAS